jgi:hypothetical protein
MKPLYSALLASTVAICCLTVQANASTVTIVSQNSADFVTNPPDQAQVALIGLSGTVYNDITGSSSGNDRSPFENNATPGSGVGTWYLNQYDAVQGNSSGYVNVALSNTMTMLWGSPDTYNSISFCTGTDGGGTCTLGAYVAGVLPITYGHDLITFDTTFTFTSILFASGQNALEFADLTTNFNQAGSTPLPAALPLFAGGLGVMGLLARRRKRKFSAVTA